MSSSVKWAFIWDLPGGWSSGLEQERTSTALAPVKHLRYRKCLTSVHFTSLSGLGGWVQALDESHLPRWPDWSVHRQKGLRTWLSPHGVCWVPGPTLSTRRVLLVCLCSFTHLSVPPGWAGHRPGAGERAVNRTDTIPAFAELLFRGQITKTRQHVSV